MDRVKGQVNVSFNDPAMANGQHFYALTLNSGPRTAEPADPYS